MEALMKGDVVVLPFPFSDLSNSKRRPALITADIDGDDFILCQITSEDREEKYSITLKNQDFFQGRLLSPSIIRPNKIFTADRSLILYKIGTVKGHKIKEVEEIIIKIFTQ